MHTLLVQSQQPKQSQVGLSASEQENIPLHYFFSNDPRKNYSKEQ